VLFVGDDEMHLLTSEKEPAAAALALSGSGPTEVVVKRGARGACAVAGGDVVSAAAQSVHVTDVIGAGDSFVAGYLAARFHGLDIADRLRWGTVCAACTVGTSGDWEGLPTRADLETRARVGLTVR
jgi:2-dehydro-3-deoxygluconokinase